MSLTMYCYVMNISVSLILAILYFYFYKLENQKHIVAWSAGWAVYALGLSVSMAVQAGFLPTALNVGSHLFIYASGLLFLWGICEFTNRIKPKWRLYGIALGVVLVTATSFMNLPFTWPAYIKFALCAAIFALAGMELRLLRETTGAAGKHIAGIAFVLWGIHAAFVAFLNTAGRNAYWSHAVTLVLMLTVSVGLLIVYFQKEKKVLVKSEERFRMFAENAQDLIYRYRLAPTPLFEYVSSASIVITGYTPDEFYADPDLYTNLIHPEDRPLFKTMNQSSGLFNEAVALRWVRKDEKMIWIELQSVPIFDLTGSLVAVECIARDITDRKQTEKFLKRVEERLQTAYHQVMDIIEFLPDATFVIDREKKVIAWNRAIEEMTGVPKNNIIGKGNSEYAFPFYGLAKPMLIDSVLTSHDDSASSKNLPQAIPTLHIKEIFAPCLYSGKGAYLWSTASTLFDSRGNLVGAIESFRDITDRKEMEKKLKYLSTHDPLTKLANRAYFEDEMKRLEGGEHDPVSIIVCDVDGLKLVNDTLGHKAGDKLLEAAANVLKKPFQTDGVVARVGGDEFAVLLRKTEKAVAEKACRSIREATGEYNMNGPDIPLSMSLGFAVRDSSSYSLMDLFKEADNNMYREKLHSGQSARSTIVTSLMKMLETRDHITEGHGDRVQELVVELAKAVNLPEHRMNDLRLLAQFHDIGKVGIPDKILFKQGSLSVDDEMVEMKRHCGLGYRIAQSVPDLIPIADWILKRHEWWNGMGYPLGIEGEEIPLECRILAIVDAYDAMTNDRPYRKGMPHSQAIAELLRQSGTQFDPHLVSAFLKLWQTKSGLRLVT